MNNKEWFKKICESLNTSGFELDGVPLPGFPSDDIQMNTTGLSGSAALYEAFVYYESCMKKFSESTGFVRPDKKLVDFGTGWGRILRFFQKDFSPDNLYGVEINKDFVKICRATFSWGTFIESNALPPVDLPDESVDFIVGYSVFSHLSEAAAMEWVKEFSRILRPGGMVAVTTRGRWFFDYCQSLQKKNLEGYPKSLSMLFPDFDQARALYDAGGFVHSNIDGVDGGGQLNKNFYGESFISETYAKKAYAPFLKVLDFDTSNPGEHPIMFFSKE